jgi:hypothetical protein
MLNREAALRRYASFNEGDMFTEMRRLRISSLCERHIVYLNKSR